MGLFPYYDSFPAGTAIGGRHPAGLEKTQEVKES